MSKTSIQWCDDSSNPVMGCEGCPLFPTPQKVAAAVLKELLVFDLPRQQLKELVDGEFGGRPLSRLYTDRRQIAVKIVKRLKSLGATLNGLRDIIWRAIASAVRCYAANLHLRWSSKPDGRRGNPGFAPWFEELTLFPGRMAKTAKQPSLKGGARPSKPWLDGMPRLVFVSDMGDALSKGVSFDYLKAEIIDAVVSREGRRHVWLWLTKRPKRMAAFAAWLRLRGMEWPENLVPMTSVLDAKMAVHVKYLREIPAKIRGLSVEPLWGPVELDLRGIDWVIVGGESGPYAKEFHLEWARALRDQCRREGKAFFLKQLGRRPVDGGSSLSLKDPHGGDWSEWPEDLRIREMPPGFHDMEEIQIEI
ncbi:DUF5131 family protein [Luteolibacter sp. LG18]|uniref:DUF5131 family protein n=1 Tax=Luteolibacter sp. LG18 TaxID=2819286 RepID=UPI0030C77185